MLARPTDLDQLPTTEAAQEVAPEVAAPAQPEVVAEAATEAPISTEGAIPDVAADGAATEPGATASEQAFGDKPTKESSQIDGGMYEPEEYRAACTSAGTPDKWDDKYVHGHTSANGWTQPYEGRYDMAFDLKKGHSASQAVKDFIAGPTIADYRVIGVAVEMDELRDQLGDQRFDQMFGSKDTNTDGQISSAQRLKITASMYTVPFAAQMLALAADNEAAASKTEEPEAPAVEARVEEKPQQGGVTAAPAPEMIAEELGVERAQEFA
jgi:hypothetical protein